MRRAATFVDANGSGRSLKSSFRPKVGCTVSWLPKNVSEVFLH